MILHALLIGALVGVVVGSLGAGDGRRVTGDARSQRARRVA